MYADADKQDSLARLGEALAHSGSQCLVWSVMTNYYHLLICVEDQPLTKLMSPLLGGYAGHYNRRHCRSGYVFQNRYPWTGHATFMGYRKKDWQSVTEVLSLFARGEGTARRRYWEFVAEDLGEGDSDALLGGGVGSQLRWMGRAQALA